MAFSPSLGVEVTTVLGMKFLLERLKMILNVKFISSTLEVDNGVFQRLGVDGGQIQPFKIIERLSILFPCHFLIIINKSFVVLPYMRLRIPN